MNTHPRWIVLVLAVLLALSACKLAGPGGITIQVGASPTPVPSDTPLPSPTATQVPPSATPAPTPTFTPPPATNPPPPTSAPQATTASAPVQPTQGPQNQPGIARVRITNGLGVPIKITLNGPEQRAFTIRGLGSMEVEVAAGTYDFNITASGYFPLNGSRTFEVGDNTWQIGKD